MFYSLLYPRVLEQRLAQTRYIILTHGIEAEKMFLDFSKLPLCPGVGTALSQGPVETARIRFLAGTGLGEEVRLRLG